MIYLVRHAESTGNIGEVTKNAKEIPLSEKGFAQAEEFAKKISQKPDLIVMSPFIRTHQTAKPLIKKFNSPTEIWDVQEFTFLCNEDYNNTTEFERKEKSKIYYQKNNPDFIVGDGAESFNQMMVRVENMLNKLKKMNKDKFVIIFSHGRFMRAALMHLNNTESSLENLLKTKSIDNTEIVEINI